MNELKHSECLTDALLRCRQEIANRIEPITWKLGYGGFERINFGPNRIIAIGAPPGVGKSSLVMQWVFDCLAIHPELKAIVCNVELSAMDIVNREVARRSQVPIGNIVKRNCGITPEIESAFNSALAVSDRIRMMKSWTLEKTLCEANEFGAKIVVLDYLQRISIDGTPSIDPRKQNSDVMTCLRHYAMSDNLGVIIVSSINRAHYREIGLGAFKESGDIEFAADACYLLQQESGAPQHCMKLEQVKARHEKPIQLNLEFDCERQYWRA